MADKAPDSPGPDQDAKTTAAQPPNDHQNAKDDPTEDHDYVPAPAPKKPSMLARVVTKLGLDVPTVAAMFKASLPSIIGIAMYQAPLVSGYFTTLGYLAPITSVLALAMLPRSKFLMNMLLSLLCLCFGAAISMLALWSAIQARIHTTPAGTEPTTHHVYNSSQSAVLGIWLFANIYFGNVVRAKLPSFNLPIIIYSIFVNVASTYGTFLTTTAQAEAFVEKLLVVMLVGLALALAVNILVFPVSSRLVVFKELAGGIGLLRKTVSLQKAYLIRLESDDMFAVVTRTNTSPGLQREGEPRLTKEAKAAKALAETSGKMRELAGKLHADITFAKREVAWGKLGAKDLSHAFTLFRNVYIPIMGMTTIIDIFKRVSERRGWDFDEEEVPEDVTAEKLREKRVWNEVMKQVHEPFEILSEAIDQGLVHAGICLEILPRPKKLPNATGDVDVEARGEEVKPGEPGFARLVDERVKAFYSKKGELLRTWVKERELAAEEEKLAGTRCSCSTERREREQSQLYVVLYMENLMHASGQAVQDLVAFADKRVEDGTMSKNRLIVPTLHRLRKWLWGTLANEDSSAEQAPDLMEAGTNIVYFGDGYNQKKDPEHLAPETAWQRLGERLRHTSAFLGSEESAFGFRAACATMSIGILAYLEKTQVFFQEQRLVWAMIMVAIGMTMTSGQSFFGFVCRVGGTVLAMCTSYIIWYIVNGKKAGVIVFLWFFTFINYYFLLKFPRFVPAIIIVIVTQFLIVGYELQVDTIGEALAERTGQQYYAIYLLAPYRLACVAGGSFVAFVWTIFPTPLTDRTWLRRDMSATLYLVANYFGVINSTLQATLSGVGGDANTPHTPANQLYHVGRKIFGKVMMLIPSMAQHAEWQRWEPTIGGKFPREAYDDIFVRSTRIMGYLTLISYTLMHPPRIQSDDLTGDETHPLPDDGNEQTRSRQRTTRSTPGTRTASVERSDREWLNALAEVIATLKPTNHTILSTLTLLSNALLSGQSLPPFMPLPRPYEMTRRLIALDHHRQHGLDAEHTHEHEGGSEDSGGDNEGPFKLYNARTGHDDYKDTRQTMLGLAGHGGRGNILDPKNMEQPGYAEFAVLQVCTTLVCDDLEGLVKAVSGLVGVVDFSFRIGGGDSSSSLSSADERSTTGGTGKGKVD
ncbi:hypothetical protein B0T25DRAFT_366156 [Lasiosphaeria hispida]|uniref:ER transporter 6TM N-terminal domain-containing protein n=1 Tax=Lasiosphaeria hispida TaxID=260671 RepID=A0AAJ0M7T2_9PEZI|nr:hypothetical protein B0T25DRAFT_366156 [Lasiosphaeria hispida]